MQQKRSNIMFSIKCDSNVNSVSIKSMIIIELWYALQ